LPPRSPPVEPDEVPVVLLLPVVALLLVVVVVVVVVPVAGAVVVAEVLDTVSSALASLPVVRPPVSVMLVAAALLLVADLLPPLQPAATRAAPSISEPAAVFRIRVRIGLAPWKWRVVRETAGPLTSGPERSLMPALPKSKGRRFPGGPHRNKKDVSLVTYILFVVLVLVVVDMLPPMSVVLVVDMLVVPIDEFMSVVVPIDVFMSVVGIVLFMSVVVVVIELVVLVDLLPPPQAETASAAPAIMETAVSFLRMSRME